jgi:3-carboxy-cis,cis-muconate cycloisomerase
MSITFDSGIYGALLSDAELAGLLSDEQELRAMLEVEAALARAQGKLGLIPAGAAARIDSVAHQLSITPETLAGSTLKSGVPITGLVAELKRALGGEAAEFVHWGATSQDIVDTALVLRLKSAADLLSSRLAGLAALLAEQAAAHRRTVMAARTRFQQAVPTSYGLKLAGWLVPLIRHHRRLNEMRGRLLIVQFGGAGGTLAALGGQGVAVTEALAAELELAAPSLPWHTQRDTIVEFAGWLSLVSASLGKIGRDVLLLAQSEVGEVRPTAAGGSSTMPQKANPVLAEILPALAQANAHALGALHAAMMQEQERGGTGWTVEWMTLPQMMVATAAALNHARALVAGLTVDAPRMRANLEASHGLVLAEAAVFALAAHMPRSKAEALVEAACKAVIEEGGHLCDALAKRTQAPVDFARLRDPGAYLGVSDEFIDQVLADFKAEFRDAGPARV